MISRIKKNIKRIIRRKSKNKKEKPKIQFQNIFIKRLLFLITILLAIFITIESLQIYLQLNGSTKKEINNSPPMYRPVYIVDSQPIDIDAYLREYFTNKVPQKTIYVNVTAYSSNKDQTDGGPYTTAYGTPVRDGIVAANFLPVGTVVRFPDKFGNKLFVVEDRMNERYSFQADIWMSDQEEAKKFGIQFLKVEIF